MALLILKYCSPGIAVLFHLPSTDLDFLFFSLFPVLPLWHGLVRTRRREMRNPLLVENVLADLKNGPLLFMPSKTLVYKQRPLPHGKLHRFAQSGVQFLCSLPDECGAAERNTLYSLCRRKLPLHDSFSRLRNLSVLCTIGI